MKMSIREATLNLQKPCTSARIAPWLAVISSRATQGLIRLTCQIIVMLIYSFTTGGVNFITLSNTGGQL